GVDHRRTRPGEPDPHARRRGHERVGENPAGARLLRLAEAPMNPAQIVLVQNAALAAAAGQRVDGDAVVAPATDGATQPLGGNELPRQLQETGGLAGLERHVPAAATISTGCAAIARFREDEHAGSM